jgi:hypothetical protein
MMSQTQTPSAQPALAQPQLTLQPQPQQVNADWHRGQIEQASETFRFLVGLVVAVWSFVIGADAALVVYGATAGSRVALFTAALMPLVCIAAWLGINGSLITLAYVALRSELKMGGGTPGIVQIYGRTILPKLESRLRRVTALDFASAEVELRRIVRRLQVGRGIVLFLAVLSVVQFIVAAWMTSH